MRFIFRILSLLLLYVSGAIAQTSTLQGTVKIPDSTNFNGTLVIRLNSSQIKNICSTPYVNVPTLSVNFPIANGVVQNINTRSFLSQDCMSPRIPYYIEILDKTNTIISTDNWYVPRTLSGVVDIGDMQEEHFTGPITVAIPYGIIGTPSVSQVLTQPTGTSMTFHGTVNFDGPVNFTAPPSFSTLIATQLLINGATGPWGIDVNGIINASGGYLVGGSAPIGTCLLSDGVSYKPGNCATTLPHIYYQNIVNNSSVFTQRDQLRFGDSSMTIVDDSTGNATNIGLIKTGSGNKLLGLANDLPASTGCAQGDGSGGITLTSNPCYNPTTSGFLDQYVTFTGCGFPAYNNLVSCYGTAIWNTAFVDNNYSIDGCFVLSGRPASVIVAGTSSKTNTGFTFVQTLVMINGSGSGWTPTVTCHGHHD
jgi:hypothetical protein